MGLFDGTVDHAASQIKQVAQPLFQEFEDRIEKMEADFLDRIDGAVIDFKTSITIRLPKRAEPVDT